MDFSGIIEELEKAGMYLRRDEPMRGHTSFRIGGPVRAMVFPRSEKDLERAVCILRDFSQKPLLLGNGTNLLVTDAPIDRIAIKTCDGVGTIERAGEGRVISGSGALLSKLAVFAKDQGLSGLEFAHGIPGSLGGAVSMNAGAYGGEMKDVIRGVTYLDAGMNRRRAEREELRFGYRQSVFSGSENIILSAELELSAGDSGEIKAKMDALAARRRESQPLNLPSGGSTFKRPKEGYAAALIEEAGLKGFAIGGARVSEKHAGFVVNRGDAKFEDVIEIMERVRETVLRKFGILLEPEVKIIVD